MTQCALRSAQKLRVVAMTAYTLVKCFDDLILDTREADRSIGVEWRGTIGDLR